MDTQGVRAGTETLWRWSIWFQQEVEGVGTDLAQRPMLAAVLTVALLWQASPVEQAWAQAVINVPPLSEWFDTVSWYSLVPALRILGAGIFMGGLINLGSTRHGSGVGAGLGMMFAGGALLLVPEIVNAIYARTTVGANWATQPGH